MNRAFMLVSSTDSARAVGKEVALATLPTWPHKAAVGFAATGEQAHATLILNATCVAWTIAVSAARERAKPARNLAGRQAKLVAFGLRIAARADLA
jgi:hypothetical protein